MTTVTPHLAFDDAQAVEWAAAIGRDRFDGTFTAEDIAEILQIHPNVVRRWIHEGKLEASRPRTFPPSPYQITVPQLRTFLWTMHQDGTTKRSHYTK